MKGKTFHIGMRTVTIGRSSSNFIQTLDEKASRTHCQVRPSIDGLAVKDMDSRNGTLVNDQPIGGPSVLDDGDEIRVGQACFRYHKRLSVAKDAGFERKNVSTVSSRTTMKGAAEDLFSILQTTIDECDGDLARASEELGCDVSTIEALIHQRATGQVDKEMMETKIEGDG